jgi:hypothetical protein
MRADAAVIKNSNRAAFDVKACRAQTFSIKCQRPHRSSKKNLEMRAKESAEHSTP